MVHLGTHTPQTKTGTGGTDLSRDLSLNIIGKQKLGERREKENTLHRGLLMALLFGAGLNCEGKLTLEVSESLIGVELNNFHCF